MIMRASASVLGEVLNHQWQRACWPQPLGCVLKTHAVTSGSPAQRGYTHVRIVRRGPWGSAHNKNILWAFHTRLSVYYVSDGGRNWLELHAQTR